MTAPSNSQVQLRCAALVGGLFLHHLFSSCWIISDSVEILFNLIAVFCLTVSRWMSSEGIAILISRVNMGDVRNTALISLRPCLIAIIS
jgi:hypothetical protein